MPIDLTRDKLLTLPEASRYLPGNPHVSTLHRWRIRGVRGVRLETVRIGGRRFVSVAALAEFCDRVTASQSGLHSPAAKPGHSTASEIESTLLREGL